MTERLSRLLFLIRKPRIDLFAVFCADQGNALFENFFNLKTEGGSDNFRSVMVLGIDVDVFALAHAH